MAYAKITPIKPKRIRRYSATSLVPTLALALLCIFGFLPHYLQSSRALDNNPNDGTLRETEHPSANTIAESALEHAIPTTTLVPSPSDQQLHNDVIARIPPKMRAITIRVDSESGVEGWARSGSSVDVIVIHNSATNAKVLEAQVIAENVTILSANRSTEHTSPGVMSASPSTATLLVTQEDALKIKTAQTIGQLTFALRGLDDLHPTYSKRFQEHSFTDSDQSAPINVKGTARGPTGDSYILDDNNRWLKQ